jgi:hypothetical protein
MSQNISHSNLAHLLGHIGNRTRGLMIGSLLVGALSSKRLSFPRLHDLFRPEVSEVPGDIPASGAFSRDALEIRRVGAEEQSSPDVGDVTDTATEKQTSSSLENLTE